MAHDIRKTIDEIFRVVYGAPFDSHIFLMDHREPYPCLRLYSEGDAKFSISTMCLKKGMENL